MDTAVSLIIPIYNAAAYLQQCLDSVTEQTLFPRMQVLLIDDGSTDASPEICDVYAQQYANIYVSHRRNAGVSAARNAGIELAVGEYVAFADADDYLLPQMMELLYSSAARTGAQLTFCDYIAESPEGEATQCFPFPQNEPFGRDEVVRYMLESERFNALWHKLFVREILVRQGVQMTVGRKLGEDREFILAYLACCETLCYVPQAGYYYRYVTSGAVRRPHRDYAKALTTQYATDLAQFALLGVAEDAFIARSAQCYCVRIAATIDIICRAYSGKARRKALRIYYADKSLQTMLRTFLGVTGLQLNRYTLGLLRCMRCRLVWATRAWMCLLDLRVKLFNKIKRGNAA